MAESEGRIVGTIKQIDDVEQVSDRFRKRRIIIETEDRFNNIVPLEATQDRVSLFDDLREGQVVRCHYDLGGRSWTNGQGEVKYFLSATVWRIDTLAQSQEPPPPPPMQDAPAAPSSPPPKVADEIPF